jgi:hypothetical protein
MHLVDILMKKTKSTQILSVYFSFFFSCFLFISQCSFANFTLNSGKRQERGRVSNRCFSMKNCTTVIFFLLLLLLFLFYNIFFPIILVLSFYMCFFLSLFSVFMFFHFCFCPLFFFLFSIFPSFTFYLYQSILKKDERERKYLFVVSQ